MDQDKERDNKDEVTEKADRCEVLTLLRAIFVVVTVTGESFSPSPFSWTISPSADF